MSTAAMFRASACVEPSLTVDRYELPPFVGWSQMLTPCSAAVSGAALAGPKSVPVTLYWVGPGGEGRISSSRAIDAPCGIVLLSTALMRVACGVPSGTTGGGVRPTVERRSRNPAVSA
jgi:hypothetical protein